MLSYLRKNAQNWIIKTILWALVAAFVGTIFLVWGRGSDTAQQQVIATVQGQPIAMRDYQTTYANLVDNYRRIFGGRLSQAMLRNLNLGQQALDQLVQRLLVQSEARRIGLGVSDAEVAQRVQGIDAFQSNGQFDPQRYTTFLQLRGMRPSHFEGLLRSDLLRERYQQVVTQAVKVTEDELSDAYRFENERAQIAHARIPNIRYRNQVDVSDADVSEFFNSNSAQFREPERRRVELLHLAYADFESDVEVSDDEVDTYYDKHSAEFTDGKEKEVRARHVLLKLETTATQEQREAIRARAQEVRVKALAGEDFAALAKEHSQGPSAAAGGDLGFFKRGDMVKAFSEAAFALPAGGISEVVESPFGYHVIKVEEVRQPKVKPLTQVRGRIVRKLKRRQAKPRLRKIINKILRDDIEGLGFAALAERYNLKRSEPQAFARSGPIAGIARQASSAVAKVAFELEVNAFSDPVETNAGAYFVHLLETHPAHLPKLEAVRTKVKQAAVRQKAQQYVRKVADGLAELIQNYPVTFDDVAKSANFKIERPKPFSRTSPIRPIGPNAELTKQAFGSKPGHVGVFDNGRDAFLFRLEEHIHVDQEKFAEEREEFAKSLEQRKTSQFFAAWLSELRQASQVTVNDALLITN